MATIAPPAAASNAAAPAEGRFLLRGIPWDLYKQLRGNDENRHVRMTYDSGTLELMSPGQKREEICIRFGLFVMTVAAVLNFKCKPLGRMTWKKPEDKAIEADGCFYIASFERVRHRIIDLAVDPPPDLVIDLELSPRALDALPIHAALGVPEVWRFDGREIRILVRRDGGTYLDLDRSPSLPFLHPGELLRWLRRADEIDDDVGWMGEVREWAQDELLPRRQNLNDLRRTSHDELIVHHTIKGNLS